MMAAPSFPMGELPVAAPSSSSSSSFASAAAAGSAALAASQAAPQAPLAAHGADDAPAGHERRSQHAGKTAQNFDRLLSLASESRINAHQMQPFIQSMQRFKRNQSSLFSLIEQLHEAIANSDDANLKEKTLLALQKTHPLKQFVLEHIADIEAYERRILAQRLYNGG